MNATLDIKCPKCAIPLRIERPNGPSELVCPKCGKRIGLTAEGQITAVEKREVFDALPAAVIAAAAPKPPKNFQSRRDPPVRKAPEEPKPAPGTFHAPVHLRGQRRSSFAWIKTAWIPLACIAATLLAGFLVYDNRDSLPLDSIVPLKSIMANLPMIDSHEKVLEEYRHVAKMSVEVVHQLRSPPAQSGADEIASTIRQLDALTIKCNDLRSRAASLPPLTPEQWVELGTWFAQRVDTTGDDLNEAVDATPMRSKQRLQYSAAFRTAAADLAVAHRGVAHAIQTAWEPIAKPEGELESIEYEALMVVRTIWEAAMAVDSEKDYQAINKAYAKASGKLDALATQLEQADELNRKVLGVSSPYFSPWLRIDNETAFALGSLQIEYGSLGDDTAMKSYHSSVDRFRSVGPSGDSPFGQATRGHGPRFMPYGTSRPRPSIDESVKNIMDNVKQQYGGKIAIFLHVENVPETSEMDAWIESLKTSVGIKSSLVHRFDQHALVVLYGPKSSTRLVADAIVDAETISVDESEHLIHLKMKN